MLTTGKKYHWKSDALPVFFFFGRGGEGGGGGWTGGGQRLFVGFHAYNVVGIQFNLREV